MTTATPTPGKLLLSPSDHTLILIDFQSQMAFAARSIDPVVLRNNAGLVANAARIFNVSTIPTTVAEKAFRVRCSTRSKRPSPRQSSSIAPA